MDEKEGEGRIVEAGAPMASGTSSREPLFGALLFGVLIFLVVAALLLLGWWAYGGWRVKSEKSTLPSISNLAVREETPTEESQAPTEQTGISTPETTPPASSADDLKNAKNTVIKVLNGGAAKGSAGTLGEALKKEGFTKAVPGNALGNYTGTTIYYASGSDKEAAALKEVVGKTYPKVETKPALSDNKETSQAPLTIILGRG